MIEGFQSWQHNASHGKDFWEIQSVIGATETCNSKSNSKTS
jgi:hypothetical protein